MAQANFFGKPPVSRDRSGTATLSECGLYRYELTRAWHEGKPRAVYLMCNPSTADAQEDDPTIRRCVSFAKREGCGELLVLNLYAFRSPDPRALSTCATPQGPHGDNLFYLERAPRPDDVVIVAWGDRPCNDAGQAFLRAHFMHPVWCLGITKAGQPRHPLYVLGDQPLVPFNRVAAVKASKTKPTT